MAPRSFDWMRRGALAADAVAGARLSRDDLIELARDSRRSVRVAVAARQDLPFGSLTALVTDPRWEVRAAIAANPEVLRSDRLYRALIADKDPRVVVSLARNPGLTIGMLQEVALQGGHAARLVAIDRMDTLGAYDSQSPVAALVVAESPEPDDTDQSQRAPVRGFRPPREAGGLAAD